MQLNEGDVVYHKATGERYIVMSIYQTQVTIRNDENIMECNIEDVTSEPDSLNVF
jgi:hypothetical protein